MERNTRQRTAIRQVLGEADRPLSPAEVLAAAQSWVPGLGMATVYRTLGALVEEGSVSVVELPGAPDRYEVAGKHAHHHFVCRRCDRVFETEACAIERVCVTPPPGFRIETHEVVLRGVCGECASAV